MIAAVGIAVIDHIMLMNGFREGEGSFHCERYICEPGGMATTAMCTAARLGSGTRLAARIGNDPGGELIMQRLRQFGVDTSRVAAVPGAMSVASFVLVDMTTGDKQFYSERIKSAYADDIPLDLSLLDGVDVLLVDGHWTDEALSAVQCARAQGIPVVADFKRTYHGLESLFPYIDYFIVPLFYGRELTGCYDPSEVLIALDGMQAGVPVLTDGANGGWYLNGGKTGQYPAFPVECLDSTGAGDAFHGAFCHFLSNGGEFEPCLELSSAVGALNCRAYGGQAALPDMEELTSFLGKYGGNAILR